MIDDELIKTLPEVTGVYIMKDDAGEIIYVGKAINIRTRVRQHAMNKSIKERLLTESTAAIETRQTQTEVEALLLECELIKKHQPRYNVLLKDGKNYPCIKLTAEAFPRACIVRRIVDDGGRYFGPYTNSSAMYESLKLIRKIFPLRTCKHFHKRPCLEFHMKRCLAPCVHAVDAADYAELADSVALFLDGQVDRIEHDLEMKMSEAAERFAFEDAARFRDRLFAVKKLAEIQKIINARHIEFQARDFSVGVEELYRYLQLPYRPRRMECFDISHNQGSETVASMVVFVDGMPEKKSYRRFKIRSTEGKPDDFASMREVTSRRYSKLRAEELPDLIVIDGGLGQLNSALETIRPLHPNVPIVALAKQFELIFVEGSTEPIELPRESEALYLMQRIRDEAHRFAITYHRLLRWKRNLQSKK